MRKSTATLHFLKHILRDFMMNFVRLALISLFLLLALVPLVFPKDDDSGSQEYDDGGRLDHKDRDHGFSDFVPRELACNSSGSGCTHKVVRYLGKAKQGSVEGGREGSGSRAVLETGSTLGKDVLSNLSEVAVDAGLQVLLRTRILDSLRLLVGLAGQVGFVTAYGMCVWVVLISNAAYARALPEGQLPAVKRVVSGVYGWAMANCLDAAVAGHYLGLRSSGKLEGYNLLASLLLVHVNLLCIEPQATKALLEKEDLEKECGNGESKPSEPSGLPPCADGQVTADSTISTEADKETMKARISGLNARIKTLNSWSSGLNVLVLVNLTLHLINLGCVLQLDAR